MASATSAGAPSVISWENTWLQGDLARGRERPGSRSEAQRRTRASASRGSAGDEGGEELVVVSTRFDSFHGESETLSRPPPRSPATGAPARRSGPRSRRRPSSRMRSLSGPAPRRRPGSSSMTSGRHVVQGEELLELVEVLLVREQRQVERAELGVRIDGGGGGVMSRKPPGVPAGAPAGGRAMHGPGRRGSIGEARRNGVVPARSRGAARPETTTDRPETTIARQRVTARGDRQRSALAAPGGAARSSPRRRSAGPRGRARCLGRRRRASGRPGTRARRRG